MKRESRPHENFTKIELLGAGIIHLVQGDSYSVEIEADEEIFDDLTSEVVEGRLLLDIEKSHKKREFKMKEGIHYYITMPTIEAIRISGGGKLECERITGSGLLFDLPGGASIDIGTVELKAFTVLVEGGAKLSIDKLTTTGITLDVKGSLKLSLPSLTAEALTSTINGTINADLAGKVNAHIISAPGVINYRAGLLQSQVCTVNASGVVNATLWVKEALTVNVEGMGNLRYYGNPRRSVKINGMGHVQRIGDAPTEASIA